MEYGYGAVMSLRGWMRRKINFYHGYGSGFGSVGCSFVLFLVPRLEPPPGEPGQVLGMKPVLDEFLVEAGPGRPHRVVIVGKYRRIPGEPRPMDFLGVLHEEMDGRRILR